MSANSANAALAARAAVRARARAAGQAAVLAREVSEELRLYYYTAADAEARRATAQLALRVQMRLHTSSDDWRHELGVRLL